MQEFYGLRPEARHTLLAYMKFKGVDLSTVEKTMRSSKYDYYGITGRNEALIDRIIEKHIQYADATCVYILCRKDLNPAQQAVQSVHAMAEFMATYGHKEDVKRWVDRDRTLVILGVKGQVEMDKYAKVAYRLNIPTKSFIDEDIHHHLETARVIGPVVKSQVQNEFKRLNLI